MYVCMYMYIKNTEIKDIYVVLKMVKFPKKV